MDGVDKAIKLNIQNHFERWASGERTCKDCPFYLECSLYMESDFGKYLCEIITGKSLSDMS